MPNHESVITSEDKKHSCDKITIQLMLRDNVASYFAKFSVLETFEISVSSGL